MEEQKNRLEAMIGQYFVVGYGNGQNRRTLADEYRLIIRTIHTRKLYEPSLWWQGDLTAVEAEYRV